MLKRNGRCIIWAMPPQPITPTLKRFELVILFPPV
jgi:hypothetical protein